MMVVVVGWILKKFELMLKELLEYLKLNVGLVRRFVLIFEKMLVFGVLKMCRLF